MKQGIVILSNNVLSEILRSAGAIPKDGTVHFAVEDRDMRLADQTGFAVESDEYEQVGEGMRIPIVAGTPT